MKDFSFSGLDPDTILDALETQGIFLQSGLLALNSYENRVYQFQADDNKRYVVKFYRPARWTDAQILEEHNFAQELANSEIPVVAPLALNGKTLHHHGDYRFTVFPSVGGRQFENDNLDQLEWMGRFIGRIHRVSQAKTFKQRPDIDTQSYLDEPRQVLENSTLLPDHLKTAFFAILNPVITAASSAYKTTDVIRLHGDCHPGNILWRDGPTFVDLDDCRMGPAIQDLWMMLSGDRQQQLLQLDTLIEAYEEFQPFNTNQLALIEPLRAMRMVHYMAWLSRRWEDPAFPRAFPWFADDKYWEGQILALKEQLSAMQEPPLKLGY
ncbi:MULTISPECIES: serine/threonine protein kinase [Alteromonas]|jgi:Ser/Thr protein kinase RdoA (MazF antagonist)|uniref:Stress response kinase A n=1 Tax=Alteromonas stellipolaris TaxID=233316 RepID=A0ABN4LNB6_9ALTE|nr:serine/threonine protein kinase [Alteromonas stellipolaris]ALM91839.1 YihE protein, a ser/thr kinase implicated [Alteromonas stellipolaris LMG 21856]AMJ73315.1 serine/threonine protein kinase [Alteromonas stellipolaris]MDO6536590.1 serine/threonine protein kinase [Alteromonas stellipolaris]MDO6624658.1 serine/threonine protein kinase [Alteromonas stellipolaris]MDP2595333.1 serine/threonine protein kinase [Alteromonas stellipolaris]